MSMKCWYAMECNLLEICGTIQYRMQQNSQQQEFGNRVMACGWHEAFARNMRAKKPKRTPPTEKTGVWRAQAFLRGCFRHQSPTEGVCSRRLAEFFGRRPPWGLQKRT
jgi:hypothetical protein